MRTKPTTTSDRFRITFEIADEALVGRMFKLIATNSATVLVCEHFTEVRQHERNRPTQVPGAEHNPLNHGSRPNPAGNHPYSISVALESLSGRGNEPVTLDDVRAAMTAHGLSPATASQLMTVLVQEGYVRRLGPGVYLPTQKGLMNGHKVLPAPVSTRPKNVGGKAKTKPKAKAKPKAKPAPKVARPKPKPGKAWARKRGARSFIVATLKTSGPMTYGALADLIEQNGWSRTSINSALPDLFKAGMITKSEPHGTYVAVGG